MFKFMGAIVWLLIALGQFVVGTKLIMYPGSATVYDYAIVLLISVPLILGYTIKKVRKV